MPTTNTGSKAEAGVHDPSLGGLVKAVKESFFKRYGLIFGVIGLLAVCLMPTPEGLPVAGKRMLAILLFSVIVWMTDSISYPVSAVVICALMASLVGMSPDVANPKAIYGTGRGLTMALGGFSNTAVALVGAALFIAAAMMHTGLDRRIALFILSKIGAKTNRVLIGVIFVGFVLSFFVPSTTARVACLVPIVMGIIVAFGFILPVNAPQNMVAYGTDTFEVRDFIRTGIPLTIAAYLLVLILGATYWKWLGLV